MRSILVLFSIAAIASAQLAPELPAPIDLKQGKARSRAKLTLPKDHAVGPVIPGLHQGAVPQGLAFWKKQNWFLISFYFPHDDGKPQLPSVVAAIDAKTGRVVRSLTLVEANGKAHTGHVGGLAVSENYLWVGSGKVYRTPLAELDAAKSPGYLRLHKPFSAEASASFIAYHDKRIWVGEFVASKDKRYAGKPAHYLKDRHGEPKHAWICGYDLDADENLPAVVDKPPPPAAVLCVRDYVQGMTFQHDYVILSTSYGRTKDSHLATYKNPLPREAKKPHDTVKVGGVNVPVWFLDGKNKVGKDLDFPPMSEGIAVYGDALAVICESGAEEYKSKGHPPLDNIIFLGRR